MIDIRLSEAITEVLEILKNADNTYMEKLPEKFKKFLNDNKTTSYIPEIDFSKELKDLKIRKETKELLGIMYLNYWSNDEEKKEYVKLLSENEKSEIQITIEHFNKNSEDIKYSSYEYQISTGKLIIIVLESIDGETLDSFTMDGIGEFIFNSLSKFIGDDVKKSDNPLDEVIEELKHFMPYGKYFK